MAEDPTQEMAAATRPGRAFDPGALLMGLWFAIVGVIVLATGDGGVVDAVALLAPVTFVVVGVGLLLPARRPS